MPTNLPAASAFTGSTVTEAQYKSAMNELRQYLADLLGTSGSTKDALAKLGALAVQSTAKTAAYTVTLADRGKVLDLNGNFTLSLTAAATLDSGFSFIVFNSGSQNITIDPSSSETINGLGTLTIGAGTWAIIFCTGTAFLALTSIPQTPPDPPLTLLGTLNTTSGTTQTLSGLDLSGYKYLYISLKNIRFSGNAVQLTFGGKIAGVIPGGATPTNLPSGESQSGFIHLDLESGVFSFDMVPSASSNPTSGVNATTYSAATTSIVFSRTGVGNFANGQIKVYGGK